MTKQQLSRLQVLTNQLARQYENMIFSVMQIGDKVIFSANNIEGLRWFEKEATLHAFIGPRGGFEKYAGTITL